ncbi:3'-5' exoribonuclease YhaM family protein [Cohnella sp. JJ-181]|uniref:3'-5' exoribonuclease YhaM family protein n=1 Tax=Cohnella rhizoplanae TaxID=2974897 RepID=UPI0022FF74A1|nr:HD domain-containing protein [Cohnella sp. JJ-181]CAI6087396.1 3'-5' exoribonuclease YhaM [Cohnella sp. JJ-181]
MTLIKEMISGNEFVGFYLLREFEVKQTNGTPAKDYFDIVLCDASGQLPAKYWDVAPAEKNLFVPMGLVKVQGIVQLYREKLQVKINRIRPAVEQDGVAIADFIKAAPIAAIDLVHTIQRTAAGIADAELRGLVEYCLIKVGDKLSHYPAAKTHHHNYYSGLAYHTVRMLELGEFICKQRPFLNADLLRAGILLHDIAKTEELTASLGIVSEYSLQGKLIGHIALASTWVTEAALALGVPTDSLKVVALQHLILSHHNLGEWGSPVQPQTAEAIALHYIDSLDAKLQMAEDALGALPDGEQWTPMIRGLENKAIYRTPF